MKPYESHTMPPQKIVVIHLLDINYSLLIHRRLELKHYVSNYFYLNKIIYVYNGLTFKKIRITEEMIGTKFGQYVFTRKFCKHKVKTITTLKKNR